MLEGPAECAFRPAQPLAPQALAVPNRLFPHLRVARPRNPLARAGGHTARQVEVLRQRDCSPAAHSRQQLAPDHDPVAAELRAAAHRPAAPIQLTVEGLLVRLGAGQPAALRVYDPPPGRDRIGPGGEVPGGTAQEEWLDPRVGVQNQDHIAPAHFRLSRGQRRPLTVGKPISVTPYDSRHVRDAASPRRRRDGLTAAVDRAVVDDDQLEVRLPCSRPIVLPGHIPDEPQQHLGFVASAH